MLHKIIVAFLSMPKIVQLDASFHKKQPQRKFRYGILFN